MKLLLALGTVVLFMAAFGLAILWFLDREGILIQSVLLVCFAAWITWSIKYITEHLL